MQRSMSKQYSPVMTCRSDGGVAVAYLGGVCGVRPGAPRVPRAPEYSIDMWHETAGPMWWFSWSISIRRAPR